MPEVPEWMIKALGLFAPIMTEFPEMLYQYEQDYIFDNSKFEKRFGITVPPRITVFRYQNLLWGSYHLIQTDKSNLHIFLRI